MVSFTDCRRPSFMTNRPTWRRNARSASLKPGEVVLQPTLRDGAVLGVEPGE
jgi:hypothetical protein